MGWRATPGGTGPEAATVTLGTGALLARCERSLLAVGATPEQAAVLARATVEAEEHRRPALGVAHLLDYLDGFRSGRISGDTVPVVSMRSDAILAVDCAGGVAQQGFEAVLPRLTRATHEHGIAVACLSRSFTVGELGFYVRQLVEHGLSALACANSPALLSAFDSRGPLLGTNPLAFGVPLPDGASLVVDQASSATAWVTVRQAAETGAELPPGVAVDGTGAPTTSAAAALAGALLPFGGYKGANIALLVELLAVLAGGSFSCAAAPFDRGSASPSIGLLVVAIEAGRFRPGFEEALRDQLRHWSAEHGAAGLATAPPSSTATREVAVAADVLARLP